MSERNIVYGTTDQLPHVSQKLRLVCSQCAKHGVYDVGTIFCDLEGKGKSAKRYYAFTNYFRCLKCHSAGPWAIDDYAQLLERALRAQIEPESAGFHLGRCTLYDGTFIQSPALGEEHLLKHISADPRNAFLHTRLGNLLRSCGQEAKAAEWYQKALSLDPGDVEARYHMFCFAMHAQDIPATLVHAPMLVRYLLEGRTTNNDELTDGLARAVVDNLRAAPETFRRHFLAGEAARSARKEDVFIRTLLTQEGEDEDELIEAAAERLLNGEPAPAEDRAGEAIFEEPAFPEVDLVPSLAQVVRVAGLDLKKLTVAFEADGQGHIRLVGQHLVTVSDGAKLTSWTVPSLRELFRGKRLPPRDIDHYPPEYAKHFFVVESQVLTACEALGDRTDQELEEVYSALRRRPDGRSLGVFHDLMWQAAALLLGRHPLSESEFTALFQQLERSTRKWAVRPVSRNYVGYLRQTLGSAE